MNKSILCVVPVYNEQEILAEAIKLLHEQLTKLTAGNFRIVVANNGSTDNTGKVADELAQTYQDTVIHEFIKQKGRGNAFRAVFAKYKCKIGMYIDVDLPCELSDLRRHISAIKKGADLVVSHRIGSRPLGRRAMTLSLRTLNRLAFGLRVSDSQCAIKAMSPDAINILVNSCCENGWFLDTELVVMVHRAGLSIHEVPIHWIEERFTGRASKVSPLHDMAEGAKAIGRIWKRARSVVGKHQ